VNVITRLQMTSKAEVLTLLTSKAEVLT